MIQTLLNFLSKRLQVVCNEHATVAKHLYQIVGLDGREIQVTQDHPHGEEHPAPVDQIESVKIGLKQKWFVIGLDVTEIGLQPTIEDVQDPGRFRLE